MSSHGQRPLLVTSALVILLPPALPAAANTYQTVSVFQASGSSPYAACDISGQEGTNYLNSELESRGSRSTHGTRTTSSPSGNRIDGRTAAPAVS